MFLNTDSLVDQTYMEWTGQLDPVLVDLVKWCETSWDISQFLPPRSFIDETWITYSFLLSHHAISAPKELGVIISKSSKSFNVIEMPQHVLLMFWDSKEFC